LHQEFQERDKVVFEQTTKEELKSMLDFLGQIQPSSGCGNQEERENSSEISN
jgi:hypothetical protein